MVHILAIFALYASDVWLTLSHGIIFWKEAIFTLLNGIRISYYVWCVSIKNDLNEWHRLDAKDHLISSFELGLQVATNPKIVFPYFASIRNIGRYLIVYGTMYLYLFQVTNSTYKNQCVIRSMKFFDESTKNIGFGIYYSKHKVYKTHVKRN